MGKANPQAVREAIERAALDHGHKQLRFRRHANRPGHHVFGHAVAGHHVPRIHKHSSAHIGAMVQESNHAGFVEVFQADVIPNLDAKVAGLHRAADLPTGGVDILQRRPAQRFHASVAAAAEL